MSSIEVEEDASNNEANINNGEVNDVQTSISESEVDNRSEAVKSGATDTEVSPLSTMRPKFSHLPKLTRKNIFILIGLFLATSILVVFIKVNNDRKELQKKLDAVNSSQKSGQNINEAEDLKKEVGQFIELPGDETPTIATVVDATKVKGQAFFAKSQNGDKVLLFAKAGKAILYRPSTKKIIEVAPINIGKNQSVDQNTNTQPAQ